MNALTVRQDLEKAVAAAESAQGCYLMFAQSTQDEMTRAMYQAMADDMWLHAEVLNDRLKYLEAANQLNQ